MLGVQRKNAEQEKRLNLITPQLEQTEQEKRVKLSNPQLEQIEQHARRVDGNTSPEPVAANEAAEGSSTVTPALLVYTLVYGEEQWRKPLMKLFIESTRRCEVDLLIIGSPRPPPDLQLPRWLSYRSSYSCRSSFSLISLSLTH